MPTNNTESWKHRKQNIMTLSAIGMLAFFMFINSTVLLTLVEHRTSNILKAVQPLEPVVSENLRHHLITCA